MNKETLSIFLKQQLGAEIKGDTITQITNGALSKRTLNNWYNGDKRPIFDLIIDGIRYRQEQQQTVKSI